MFDFDLPRERGRQAEIEAILDFVSTHRHSYASLAVCRRALDSGISEIDGEIIEELRGICKRPPTTKSRRITLSSAK